MGLLDRIVSRKVESESPAGMARGGRRADLFDQGAAQVSRLSDVARVASPARPWRGRRQQRQLFRRTARLQDFRREYLRGSRATRPRQRRSTRFPISSRRALPPRVGLGRRHPVLGHHRLPRSPVGARAHRSAGARAAARRRAARLLRHGAAARHRSTRSTSSWTT